MKNITDIFFDLDHTLWDFDKNSILAFEKIFKIHQLSIDVNQFIEIYAPINQSCWKLYQLDKITHKELRYERLRQTFDIMHFEIENQMIDTISNDYIEFLPDNNLLFDGAIELLEYLYPKYKLHIITNGFAEVQKRKMYYSGLEKYFQTVTNSEIAGVKKPHRNIFQFALSLAKTDKENAVMIGDCIDADFNGALEFGIRAILFDEKKIYQETTFERVSHLLEIKNIL